MRHDGGQRLPRQGYGGSTRAWREHAWVTAGLTEACVAALLVYILLVPEENVGALLVLDAITAATAPLLLLIPLSWYDTGAGQRANAIWIGAIMVVISVGAHLDGGPDSAIVWFYVLAIIIAAHMFPPRDVAGIAVVMLLGYLGITVLADAFRVETIVVMFVLAALAGVTTWVSYTRYRALDRLQRLATRLADADAARERFIAATSHELRTPVASILGYVELLEDAAAVPGADLEPHLETVRRNAERLLATTDGLLELARSDEERRTAERRAGVSDVAVLAQQVTATMAPLARKQSVRLETVVDDQVAEGDWKVAGSPEQLERVLLNLLSNAVKYTLEGGQVCCRLARSDGVITVTVRDTGIGMTSEDVSRLFTRFFRAPSAKERAISGTGLGLSIVHDVVSQLGGDVEVTSTPGEGSCFVVRLPAA